MSNHSSFQNITKREIQVMLQEINNIVNPT